MFRLPQTVVGSRPAGFPVVDLAGAVLVGVLAAADMTDRAYGPAWLAGGAVVVVLSAGTVGLRTRRPDLAALLLCLSLLASAVLPQPRTPLWGFVVLLLVSFSTGAHLGGRRQVIGLAAILASTYPLQWQAGHGLDDRLVSPLVIVGAGGLAGALVRRYRVQAARLAELAHSLSVERGRHAELAALAERARIAREVHDVIAHSVSLMVVQAGAAACLLPDDAPARTHLAAVRATGREALAELRGLLAVLREGGGEPSAAQPGIGELIALAHHAGARVTVQGTPRDVGPAVALTAYQVTREALTNARRHAAGAAVEVELSYEPTEVSLRVTDTGRGDPPRPDAASGGGDTVPQVDGPPRRGGHGIDGMRERVAVHGGHLRVGPRPGSGWEVQLRLPSCAGQAAAA